MAHRCKLVIFFFPKHTFCSMFIVLQTRNRKELRIYYPFKTTKYSSLALPSQFSTRIYLTRSSTMNTNKPKNKNAEQGEKKMPGQCDCLCFKCSCMNCPKDFLSMKINLTQPLTNTVPMDIVIIGTNTKDNVNQTKVFPQF